MNIADLGFVVCILLIAVGAGLVFMPAGLIAGGLLGGGFLWLAESA